MILRHKYRNPEGTDRYKRNKIKKGGKNPAGTTDTKGEMGEEDQRVDNWACPITIKISHN